MRFFVRRTALAIAAGAVMLWCSCERHRVGELAPAQDGHQTDEAHAHAAGTAATVRARVSPAASAAGTPVQFFPAATPH